MDSFIVRERRSALAESVDERVQTNQRESARDEFAPRRASANTEIGSQIQQMLDGVVRKIDGVIAELRHRREAIVEESMRMHREIVAYTKLNQAAMDSTRVISGSLANLVKVADAPAITEMAEAVSDKEDRNSAAEQSATDDSRILGTPGGVPMPRKRKTPNE
jgi:hypothetical protein